MNPRKRNRGIVAYGHLNLKIILIHSKSFPVTTYFSTLLVIINFTTALRMRKNICRSTATRLQLYIPKLKSILVQYVGLLPLKFQSSHFERSVVKRDLFCRDPLRFSIVFWYFFKKRSSKRVQSCALQNPILDWPAGVSTYSYKCFCIGRSANKLPPIGRKKRDWEGNEGIPITFCDTTLENQYYYKQQPWQRTTFSFLSSGLSSWSWLHGLLPLPSPGSGSCFR